ncbi:WD40-repeat-containing domain protein [Clohesyomyces aquaticus]|uniref:WD40-repeat-containing domain protein n=1 Tax=Clohesyomyces aquaticus TaxID=1231657 RepID=A0A1Y2ABD7_9PLEO|nr:WD40-repeat-containing domain protein [Clohesyomyces aquaticus]
MSPVLQHEHTLVPVTALATHDPLLYAGEGPYLRLYQTKNNYFLSTKQVFKSQSIHGVRVLPKSTHHVILILWGGFLVRALEIKISASDGGDQLEIESLQLSPTVRASDWILDLSICSHDNPKSSALTEAVCAAVTAHNALLELTIESVDDIQDRNDVSRPLRLRISDLTSSSRSILYAAHLLWESPNHVLIAAGTAFGEIILWSWTRGTGTISISRIHRVFLGHEGSVFGVCISNFPRKRQNEVSRRLLASCSDDRTIRIWDISGISIEETSPNSTHLETQRTRHTGFSNETLDSQISAPSCLAVGWGHASRVWTVDFLDIPGIDGTFIVSAAEDATSRLWEFVKKENGTHSGPENSPFTLAQLNSFACHNGKNIWSTTICRDPSGLMQLLSGAADGQITVASLNAVSQGHTVRSRPRVSEYSVQDIITLSQPSTDITALPHTTPSHKSSKLAEFFRSYAFVGGSSFILTTNSGKVYLETVRHQHDSSTTKVITNSRQLDDREDLLGYSVCTGESSVDIAFVVGSRGQIYVYKNGSLRTDPIFAVAGKVGSMFARRIDDHDMEDSHIILLITLVGQKNAQLLFVDIPTDPEKKSPTVSRAVSVPLPELQTGLVITSMAYVNTLGEVDYISLGFRRGSVAIYSISRNRATVHESQNDEASLMKIVEQVHGKETVTAMLFYPSSTESNEWTIRANGYLYSVGRDGHLSIHHIDFSANTVSLLHNLALPMGPNLEGLYHSMDSLMIFGFSSTKLILYNSTKEKEEMAVETGGAHRSWAFQPHDDGLTNTLVWTRASSMNVCVQERPSHQIIRHGGHGREIKAVAVSPPGVSGTIKRLIATGAEDTDIKIFEYPDHGTTTRRTLRKHTTGIQHLQWSDDGNYLFSSGGREEFYVWRIRVLAQFATVDVLAVCESVFEPEDKDSDLRITSFDVQRRDGAFLIAMVFSDSTIKISSYSPTAAHIWQTLAKGTYTTTCLTQCVFLSPPLLLTASTDGHTATWTLPSTTTHPHTSDTQTAEPLTWSHPAKLHQSSSKSMASVALSPETTLIVSGGDDCSLSFLVTEYQDTEPDRARRHPPIIVTRAHASAVTACAIVRHDESIFVITSGNDQWVRLWEVVPRLGDSTTAVADGDALEIRRVRKIKTNVADVSDMEVLDQGNEGARVLICGVGMEVIRIAWDA